MEYTGVSKNNPIYSFIGISILFGIASGMLQFLFPLYAMSLQAEKSGIGVIRGIAQLGGLISSLPAGFLTDRFGYRRVLIWGGVTNAALFMVMPLKISLPVFAIFLFLEGAVRTLGWTALNTEFISQLGVFGFEKSGWTRASLGVGMSFLGPLICGQLVSRMSYQVVLLWIGIATLLPVILICCSKGKVQDHNSPPVNKIMLKSLILQLKQLLANKKIIRVASIQSLAIACNTAYTVFVVVLLVDTVRCPSKFASWIVAAQGIGMVGSMFWSGRLLAFFNLFNLYFLGFGLQILGLLTVGIDMGIIPVWPGSIIFGIGTGLISNLSYTQLGQATGEKGKTAGLFYLITGTGIALGPVFSGLLGAWFGVRAAFYSFVPLILGVLVYLWVNDFKNYRIAIVAKGSDTLQNQ